MNFKENFQFLMKESGKHKIKLFISCLFSVVSSILSILPYFLIYYIVIALIQEDVNHKQVQFIAYGLGGVLVLRLILFLSSGVFSHIAAFNILYELRMKVVKHISTLNMGFFTGQTIGNVKKTINEDIEKLENFIAHQLPDLSAAIMTPLVVIIYLFFLDFRLALLMFVPVILGVMCQIIVFKDYSANMKRYHELLERVNKTIIQFIHGITVMKAFNVTAKGYKQMKIATEEYADFWEWYAKKASPYYAAFLVIIDSGLLFIVPFGGWMLIKGMITIPTFILFMILSNVFLSSFKVLIEFAGNFSMLLVGAGRVRDILNMESQTNGTKKLESVQGAISYKNVTFKYDQEEVIKDFSLEIQPGEVIALVGPSGSGKTTVGKLIGRFWDIQEGEIRIDENLIQNIEISSLMDQVSFVFQDVFMTHDTILNNVKMGKEYSFEEIQQACKKAYIHDLIMSLPNQYETKLGEDGIKLSGGEKQRISIARAILKGSPIVILDEVTSYSDIENEKHIQNALQELLKDKTAIIIAHRLYTIKDVDQIIVMDEGSIVEKGSHDELMSQCGLYRKLWDLYDEKTYVEERGA
ncbi:ABC transporter ATP-binding protein [Clostridium sp. D2Q-14]|uniref:ABC transporter ATP-binding protein n=1 Tax=Anaeromonas gelatinilytica TaxID=2683194 RepID=UPI00193BE22F|nr:ABC transporter ATP-binding protein [Anaeromonas gelatinilytica]MBS4536294.1 ABC transporter ATP-binding protein [Anaeromonas gelatinilytica]